jgi:aspartate carbamoyltransferase catalytic subunit
MNETLGTRHLLGIDDLGAPDIDLILRTADGFKEVLARPVRKVPSLRDITIANIFFENSTRTRLSFELAERRLSADVVNFTASTGSTKKGETLLDTVNNILAMKVDLVVMRHQDPGACVFLAQHTKAGVVNAGDGAHEHPTQALLDAYSIRERFGKVAGVKVAIVGDILHSRVAWSNVRCLRKLGAEVMLCGPVGLMPRHAAEMGVTVCHDLDEALRWCDVANMLRIQMERLGDGPAYFPSLREYTMLYGLDRARYERIGRPVTIMHPGPINRGVELASDMADGPASIILQQVENGVAVRMAVLYLLAAGIGRGGNS